MPQTCCVCHQVYHVTSENECPYCKEYTLTFQKQCTVVERYQENEYSPLHKMFENYQHAFEGPVEKCTCKSLFFFICHSDEHHFLHLYPPGSFHLNKPELKNKLVAIPSDIYFIKGIAAPFIKKQIFLYGLGEQIYIPKWIIDLLLNIFGMFLMSVSPSQSGGAPSHSDTPLSLASSAESSHLLEQKYTQLVRQRVLEKQRLWWSIYQHGIPVPIDQMAPTDLKEHLDKLNKQSNIETLILEVEFLLQYLLQWKDCPGREDLKLFVKSWQRNCFWLVDQQQSWPSEWNDIVVLAKIRMYPYLGNQFLKNCSFGISNIIFTHQSKERLKQELVRFLIHIGLDRWRNPRNYYCEIALQQRKGDYYHYQVTTVLET